MLPEAVQRAVSQALGAKVVSAVPVGGGCIAHATRLETTTGPYFLKWMSSVGAEALRAEADGLRALAMTGSSLRIPHLHHVGATGDGDAAILIMEWLPAGGTNDTFWIRFGRDLAALHRITGTQFGHERDNFIGQLPQINSRRDSWPAFFRDCRLIPQVEAARRAGRWPDEWTAGMDGLLDRLDELLPITPAASILHGDLWSGNFLATSSGAAALVDPAVYYGDRETDLALTRLFGGFDTQFYDTYQEAWSMEPGFSDRFEIYNLYHLINHLNHFGAAYARGVANTLSRFA